MSETNEEMNARHRKELKALEGEKRAETKKTKSTAGKKAKAAIATLEAEYESKLKCMKERHGKELSDETPEFINTDYAANIEKTGGEGPCEPVIETEEVERQRKVEKARLKREKQRQKELRREQEISKETANAGPLPREVENKIILQQLAPLNMIIAEVKADGHCLYRAVAAQCQSDYLTIRKICSETLKAHEDDFAPFCEYTDTVPDFQTYVERVRSSADWGGHLELRAISMALKRPVWIFSSTSPHPLVIEEQSSDVDPIRLSYHLKYYALGEHYNQVINCTRPRPF
jgi:OTU domain-containing protein 6